MSGGAPRFLSRPLLGKWLSSVPDLNCMTGRSASGEDCYILEFSGEHPSPIAKYELFIQVSDFKPIALNSYLPSGEPYSITELEFGDNGDSALFCRRAQTRIFNGTNLCRQSDWRIVNILKTNSVFPEGGMVSLFPEGTRVIDTRYGKPISYKEGARPPNDKEIKAMLQNPRGDVKYQIEARSEKMTKILAAAPSAPITDTAKALLPRILIFACLLTPLLAWVLFRKPTKH